MTQHFYFWEYTKEAGNTNSKEYICPYVTAAFFTIAKVWKQPKWPSADEWIKQSWHIYTMNITHP